MITEDLKNSAVAMKTLTEGGGSTATETQSSAEDARLAAVESQKNAALSEVEQTYDDMLDQSDSVYQGQIDASKEWAEKQSQIQQEQTDFAIEQIEQQKKQTEEDYLKEQSGAYVDYQKQIARHGVNAEQEAAAGLAGSGYSESSKVSMYNTYQNRVATARAAMQQAITEYNNAITEARLQNSAALAEIAYNALQEQLSLALEGFQYKNSLILDKLSTKQSVEAQYHEQYMDMLDQINQEAALEEEKRQFDAELALAQGQSTGTATTGVTIAGADTVSEETEDVNYTIENTVTDNGVMVDGKEMSWSELLEAVENGTVTESVDEKTGKCSYTVAETEENTNGTLASDLARILTAKVTGDVVGGVTNNNIVNLLVQKLTNKLLSGK